MKIRKGSKEDIESCLEIGKNLPKYFTELGLSLMKKDLEVDDLFVMSKDHQIISFISIKKKNKDLAEISWFATNPDFQKQGFGSSLFNFVVDHLKKLDFSLLMIKTASDEYEEDNYALTRTFYEKRGFILIETISSYSEWDGQSCSIYVKIL